jgi:hypothetical protein
MADHLTARREGQPLTPRELKQRREAAAKRRKPDDARDRSVAMGAFKAAGLKGGDIFTKNGQVAGVTSPKHAALINAMRAMGWKISKVEEDGSATATLNGKTVKLGNGSDGDGKFFDSKGRVWDSRVYSLEGGKAVKRRLKSKA